MATRLILLHHKIVYVVHNKDVKMIRTLQKSELNVTTDPTDRRRENMQFFFLQNR